MRCVAAAAAGFSLFCVLFCVPCAPLICALHLICDPLCCIPCRALPLRVVPSRAVARVHLSCRPVERTQLLMQIAYQREDLQYSSIRTSAMALVVAPARASESSRVESGCWRAFRVVRRFASRRVASCRVRGWTRCRLSVQSTPFESSRVESIPSSVLCTPVTLCTRTCTVPCAANVLCSYTRTVQ